MLGRLEKCIVGTDLNGALRAIYGVIEPMHRDRVSAREDGKIPIMARIERRLDLREPLVRARPDQVADDDKPSRNTDTGLQRMAGL